MNLSRCFCMRCSMCHREPPFLYVVQARMIYIPLIHEDSHGLSSIFLALVHCISALLYRSTTRHRICCLFTSPVASLSSMFQMPCNTPQTYDMCPILKHPEDASAVVEFGMATGWATILPPIFHPSHIFLIFAPRKFHRIFRPFILSDSGHLQNLFQLAI